MRALAQPGDHLRELRNRLGVTTREVEELSRKIAEDRGNDEFSISNAWLTQLENKNSVPSIYKLFSLSVIYRAKFVPTVFAARQFVNHGHIKVNGKRVNIPSYRVKVGDVVEIKEKSKQMNLVLEAQALAERDVPDYIEVDAAKLTAKLSRIPVITDVPYPVQMEPHLVIEYYSR